MIEITVESANSFINTISPTSELFQDGYANYVFRGQGCSTWQLLPSVFRSKTELPLKGRLAEKEVRTYREQRELEWNILRSFVLELNKNGLHVPNESLLYTLQEELRATDESNGIGRLETLWPNEEYFSLLALGQHFGLPTRMLDWSYSAFVAAYFAAAGNLSKASEDDKSEYFSVYALNTASKFLESELDRERIEFHEDRDISVPDVSFRIVNPITYFNKNLTAQKGLFLCCFERGLIKNYTFKPASLEEHFANKQSSMKDSDGGMQLTFPEERYRSLIKINVPSQLAEEALSLLDLHFVNASTLFPGIEGCVKSLFDRKRFT